MGLLLCTLATRSSSSCTLKPGSSVSSLATQRRWAALAWGSLVCWPIPSLTPCPQVSALALDGSGSLLASAQAWPHSMLRLWDFQTGSCLALFRSPVHTVCSLRWVQGLPGGWVPTPVTLTVASVHSFSNSGELLCGVGKDRHGRTVTGLAGRWDSCPRLQAGGRDPCWPPPAWPGTPTSHTSQGICLTLVDRAVL